MVPTHDLRVAESSAPGFDRFLTLTSRQRRLVLALLQSSDWVSLREFASRLETTPRAIRYDLDSVKRWLRDWQITFVSKRGKGVRLGGEPDQRERLRKALLTGEAGQVVAEPAERQRLIVAALLGEGAESDFDGLCSRLAVSPRTLYYDLSEIERRHLSPLGVSLARPRRGRLSIVGDELRCREAVYALIRHVLRPWMDIIMLLLEAREPGALVADEQLRPLWGMLAGNSPLSPAELVQVFTAIRGDHDLHYISDVGLAEFGVCALIALRRFTTGRLVELDRVGPWVEDCRELHAARRLADRIDGLLPHRFTDGEICYLALRLLAAEPSGPPGPWMKPRKDRMDAVAESVAREIISVLEPAGQRRRLRNAEAVTGLTAQLRPILIRSRFGIATVVPSFAEVTHRYPGIFETVSGVGERMKADGRLTLSQPEMHAITAHLAAFLERLSPRSGLPKSALVVCPCGTAWVNMITARLRSEFPYLKLGTATVAEALRCKPSDWDLVVSTVGIRLPLLPVVVVSPVLTNDDVLSIHRALSGIAQRGLKADGGSSPAASPMADPVRLPSLGDLIDGDLICLDARPESADEAIGLAGSLLERRNLVERRYLAAMRRMFRLYGPYLVIAPGVAMPHARPEDGALAPGLSFVRLTPALPFGPDPRHMVDLLFGLATTDDVSPERAITDLVDLLQDPARIDLLRHGGPLEVLTALRSTERRRRGEPARDA